MVGREPYRLSRLVSLSNLFRTRYAPHLLYASETNYNEPNVKEPAPEPKDVEDSESEQEVKEPEPEVKEAEVVKLSVETLVDLPTELTMGLLSLSTPIIFFLSLRSSDVYDPLQIFLHEARSHEIKLDIVQSAVCSVFIMDESHLSATCDRFDPPPFTFDVSTKTSFTSTTLSQP